MSRRVDLRFETLDEVMPEVERLLAGHGTVGTWSLAQICRHLAEALRLTVEGPPGLVEPTRGQRAAVLWFFRAGRFPEGQSVPVPSLEPGPGLEPDREAAALGEALTRFSRFEGPFPAHPVLGPLTRDQWVRFHCMHAAHHLGFVVPAS